MKTNEFLQLYYQLSPAGYPVFFCIRYPADNPLSQILYMTGYRL
jgi:hypothetical protein